MPCNHIGGAIVCSRTRLVRCRDCNQVSRFLCDYPVAGTTCDRPMCADHATEVGPDRHYCKLHRDRAA